MNERNVVQAGHFLAGELHKAEKAMAEAYAQLGRLAAALPEAQARANLSAMIGRKLFTRVGTALEGAAQSYVELGEAHMQLLALQRQLGLQVYDFGDGTDRPNGALGIEGEVAVTPKVDRQKPALAVVA